MRSIYLVPTALLEGFGIGAHRAMPGPADPALTLLVVFEWVSDLAQDVFESHPQVLKLDPWKANDPAPAALVSAFNTSKIAALGVSDTIETALWKIRAQCPEARWY